jgi:hypothetical protein
MKIRAIGTTLGLLTDYGDIFLFSVESSMPFKPIRVLTKLAAIDFDLSWNHTIILCDSRRLAYVGTPVKKKINLSTTKAQTIAYDFARALGLHDVVKVSASPAGTYAAIRKNYIVSLSEKNSRLLYLEIYLFWSRCAGSDLGGKPFTQAVSKLMEKSTFSDIVFESKEKQRFYAHRFIVVLEGSELHKMLQSRQEEITSDDSVEVFTDNSTGHVVVHFREAPAERLSACLASFYVIENESITSLVGDVLSLKLLFAPTHNQRPCPFFSQKHVKPVLNEDPAKTFADVIIQLKDGKVACHRLLLCSRSPFFQAFLSSPHWNRHQE